MSAGKVLFWCLSFVPLLLGIGLVVFGAVTSRTFGPVCTINHVTLPASGLIPGIFIIVLIVFGWICMCAKSRFLGYSFLTLVFLVSLSCFVFLIIAAVYRSKANFYATECVKVAVNGYKQTDMNQRIMDVIQQSLNCCGLISSEDWKNMSLPIPESCCKKEFRGPGCTNDTSKMNLGGCIEPLEKGFITSIPYLLGLLGLLSVSLVILGIIYASTTEISERHSYREL
ncbi:Tetraspanin-6 [Thelohanellus kitauei]|uniref:Tetraspanin-6 n=1 Tax=Thelohanellus kitauei TaxID=669202 RepID=A0A0C2IA67_THEKT|nr:Tetraspanin-6 [Thelohanellus kitauei]